MIIKIHLKSAQKNGLVGGYPLILPAAQPYRYGPTPVGSMMSVRAVQLPPGPRPKLAFGNVGSCTAGGLVHRFFSAVLGLIWIHVDQYGSLVINYDYIIGSIRISSD